MTKILLVEDDKSLREIYGVRLLAEGYDIVSAGDGEQALAMAIKERPQLIVSDVMMPKISGFDMLDILRSTTETKDIRVIMMTALSSEDQRARGQALGADRYLVKSQVGIEDVVRTVHEVLGDAPIAGAGQMFTPSSPTPAAARPAPVVPPRQAPPAPSVPQPQVAPPVPVAAPLNVPEPTLPPTPPASNSSMPQPTAPFSTNRPTGLGERIIHPISQPAGQPDLGSLMDQELSNAAALQQPVSPPITPSAVPAPPPPPASPPVAAPAPLQQQPMQTPPPQSGPDPDITFEETPRQAPPPPGSQPPVAG